MAERAHQPEVAVWTDARGSAAAAAVLDRLAGEVRPIAVGGPRVSEVTQLARRLDCGNKDDLRHLLVDHPASYLLLTTMEGASADELLTATAAGTIVLSLEPIAADLAQLDALTAVGVKRIGRAPKRDIAATLTAPGAIVHLPAFGESDGFLHAADPFETLGPSRLVSLQSLCAAGQGSLFARLFDAWRTVLRLIDMPLSVDASLLDGRPAHGAVESLREMTGRLAVHARAPEQCAAVLHVADTAPHWKRRVEVLGEAGQLHVDDAGFELRQRDDTLVDHRDAPGDRPKRVDPVQLIAGQWQRLLDRGDPPPPVHAHHDAAALACCLACLLSARTGQAESPQRMLEMNR